LSLDKWINSEDKNIKKKKIKRNLHESKESKIELDRDKTSIKLKKYTFNCPKSKCNYQKTILKKNLNENDGICPRCRGKMKIQEL